MSDREEDPGQMEVRMHKRIIAEDARKQALLQGEPLAELRALSKARLVERHDALLAEAKRSNIPDQERFLARAQIYADELARKEAVEQGERMEALTTSLNRLTWAIAIATFIAVGLTVLALFVG